ncbi:MAG: crossover junction endodeoxyribonuclease RuvC [Candidatus Binatia bacterium]
MRVLGIDPGTSVTGWAVVEGEGGRVRRVASGGLRLSSQSPLSMRLARIHETVMALIAEHRPLAVSLEKAFVSKNPQSAFRIGEARGAILVAAAQSGLEVFEYAPAEVKQSLVGYGRADKEQIARGVALLFAIEPPSLSDEADALAVAACHLAGLRLRRLMERAR